MMIKRMFSVLALLAAPLMIGSAHAALINQYTVTIDDGRDIEYAYFDVVDDGGFALTANAVGSSSVDPELFLFNDYGTPLAAWHFIATDDDSGSGLNSRIDQILGVGSYVLATGDFNLTLTEVINGVNRRNGNAGTGDVILGVTGQEMSRWENTGCWYCYDYVTYGAGSGAFTSEVPEPTSIALLGIGLIAAGAGVRRKSKSA